MVAAEPAGLRQQHPAATVNPEILERMHSAIEAYGKHPAGGRLDGDVDRVVVVPAGASLDDAHARARRACLRGERVRIVGCGVTYRGAWPAWALEAPRLSLVELGAYEARTRMAASRPLATSLAVWCDTVFDDVLDGIPGREVFASGAAARLLQGALDAAAVVEGLRAVHPGAAFEVVDATWAGTSALIGGSAPAARELTRALPWAVAAGIVASGARALREFQRGAPSRAELRRQSAQSAPRLWLGLIPDWSRANKHLVSTLAREVLDRGDALGVLLVGSWGVGARDDATHATLGDEVWPGLTWLRDYYPGRLRVVQAVMPAKRTALVAALGRAARASARAASRVQEAGLPPGTPATVDILEVAKLLSRDVAQAVLAAAAAREAREHLGSSRIVFCAANLPALASVERVLARSGVPTAEYMHGVGNDAWHGTAESRVPLRFVWTSSDAEGLSPTGQRTVIAGLPVPSVARRSVGYRNVLVLTNYFHRDLASGARVAQRGAYQRELLAIPALLRAKLPDLPLSFRWRSHPAEVPRLIEGAFAQLEDVELSTAANLNDDLTWADVVVSAHSSTVVESLFAGRPVFVHLRPELVISPFSAYAHQARRFCTAEEGARLMAECIRILAAGNHDTALAPEREARRWLLGSGREEPVSLFDAVQEWIETEATA